MNKINVQQMLLAPNDNTWGEPKQVVATYSGKNDEHYLVALDSSNRPSVFEQTDDRTVMNDRGYSFYDLMVINPTVVTNPAQINAALAAIRNTADKQSAAVPIPVVSNAPVPTSYAPNTPVTLEGVVDDILDGFTNDEKLFTSLDVTLEVRKRTGFEDTHHWQVRNEVAAWMDNNMVNRDYTTSQIAVSGGNLRATLYHPEDADASDYNDRNQTTKQGSATMSMTDLNPAVAATQNPFTTGGYSNVPYATFPHNGPVPLLPGGSVTFNPPTTVSKSVTVDRQNDRIRIPKSVVRDAGYSPGDSVTIETLGNGLLILPLDEDTSEHVLTVTLDGRINVTEYWLHKANLLSSVNVRVTENNVTKELMIEIRG